MGPNPIGFHGLLTAQDRSVSFRKIFPSHDWNDEWYVNQIVRLPVIVGKEKMGFLDGVPIETVKADDNAIRNWINEKMDNCSCVILFVGEKTYQSKWCLYEIERACELGKGRFIINLEGMKNKDGSICKGGPDPYKYHNRYVKSSGNGPKPYIIKSYNWIRDNGQENIGKWIEDACQRAGK